jgi:hypothetical protein
MISFTSSGSFAKTIAFLTKSQKYDILKVLDQYGQEGVTALANATPTGSGLAANSWYYKVAYEGKSYSITWYNNDVENGFPVAIMLQYGYGTGTGGYVEGEDYINPTMKPIFDKISAEVWKAVTAA